MRLFIKVREVTKLIPKRNIRKGLLLSSRLPTACDTVNYGVRKGSKVAVPVNHLFDAEIALFTCTRCIWSHFDEGIAVLNWRQKIAGTLTEKNNKIRQ